MTLPAAIAADAVYVTVPSPERNPPAARQPLSVKLMTVPASMSRCSTNENWSAPSAEAWMIAMSPCVRTVMVGALPSCCAPQRPLSDRQDCRRSTNARAAAARAIDAACARSRRAQCSSRIRPCRRPSRTPTRASLYPYTPFVAVANFGNVRRDFRSNCSSLSENTDRQLRPFLDGYRNNDNEAWRVTSCADTRIADGALEPLRQEVFGEAHALCEHHCMQRGVQRWRIASAAREKSGCSHEVCALH